VAVSGGAHQLFDPEMPPVAHDEAAFEASVSDQIGPESHEDAGLDVLSIGEFYDEVQHALAQTFPRGRQLWIRGEITQLTHHRSGHLYFSLVDPDPGGRPNRGYQNRGGAPSLRVTCWRTTWATLRRRLAKSGVELAEGMVVVLRGTPDVYRARSELSFNLVEVDVTAILGQLQAKREQLLGKLETEGLLTRNASLRVPEPALHIGLVASPGTEGYNDFLGQLTESGLGFQVSFVPVSVQGANAPATIARALRMVSHSNCDVVALVRGGGAKADLAAFETEIVARAVATCAKPVFTGIGHTGDETVADMVASRACITPTQCGHAIVGAAAGWWHEHVATPAAFLADRVPGYVVDAQSRDTAARRRLTASARHQLRVHRERLGRRGAVLRRSVPERVGACEVSLRSDAARLAPLVNGVLGRQEERLVSWRRLLSAYDVERQLERGYSLTTTESGALVRGAAALRAGAGIVTRFADGSARSVVQEVTVDVTAEDEG
jgi:exodeoxyribonuclease VII large subunit